MRSLLLALLLLPATSAVRAQDEETQPIQRYLVNLQLGDDLEEVRRIYPPAQEWPSSVEPRGKITRYRVERAWAKRFPPKVQILYLGFRKGRLVEIEAIYDAKFSAEKTHGMLAGELSLLYGEPGHTGERFWWADSKTVMRVFPAELPVLKDGAKAVEWHTAIQIYQKGVFESVD